MTSVMQARKTGGVMCRTGSPDSPLFDVIRPPSTGCQAQSLSALVEGEIIPRLIAAHAGDRRSASPVPSGRGVIAQRDVDALVPLSLQVEADALIGHVDAILARGVTVDAVLVDLLAPAARLLGEHWKEDRCDFIDVTMALWRLQEVVHELAARHVPPLPPEHAGRRALFASMPGDQHSFGTVVIDEVFRRDGWLTDRMSDAETADLLHRVADQWFDLVGLTVSCDCHVATLGPIIVGLRNVSRNPRVCVMVGGRVFGADPALAHRVGADGTARDAKIALRLADSLVRTRVREVAACG